MFVAVEDDLIDHPKTEHLCLLLDDDFAWKYLILLWRWAMHYAKDGDLSRYDVGQIERAMRWRGGPGELVAALEKAGFIVRDLAGIALHDWMEYQGRWVEKLERDKERKRTSRGCPTDVQRTSIGRRADGAGTRPDPTRPNPTEECGETTAAAPIAMSDPDPEPETALLEFPVDGDPGRPTWALTASVVSELGEAYPSLDVMDHARRALAWVKAHPSRRKTARGMRAFLTGWLGREQNSGRAAPNLGPPRAIGDQRGTRPTGGGIAYQKLEPRPRINLLEARKQAEAEQHAAH